ncbi:FMN-binding negative transcriptional regulator [Halioxenophilus aromaticivorans]|uniref:FMN-binding negative transcriptional regulator n=1 Tax=Halioxenophilus aromaticivorans TaxID=1306992 RepID=A0AAV3U218_9ALTE
MHSANPFNQQDVDALTGLIKEFPLATLVASSASGEIDADRIQAVHVPFVVGDCGSQLLLQAHIAQANGWWRSVEPSSRVLAVFNGPNAYITPNFYPTKQKHGRAVPTWNYAVVHVRGKIRFVEDKAWLSQVIAKLTQQQEQNEKTPWSMDDAPPEYIERLLAAVIGIEVEVESITGQWKLSQNQPKENIAGVIEGLNETGCERHQEMARWISAEQRD